MLSNPRVRPDSRAKLMNEENAALDGSSASAQQPVSAHYHEYDLSAWPEGRCRICGDIGMYPPVERVPIEGSREGYRSLHPSSGPAFWCQVCGAHFMTQRWADDHLKAAEERSEVHVIIQLRYEGG